MPHSQCVILSQIWWNNRKCKKLSCAVNVSTFFRKMDYFTLTIWFYWTFLFSYLSCFGHKLVLKENTVCFAFPQRIELCSHDALRMSSSTERPLWESALHIVPIASTERPLWESALHIIPIASTERPLWESALHIIPIASTERPLWESALHIIPIASTAPKSLEVH